MAVVEQRERWQEWDYSRTADEEEYTTSYYVRVDDADDAMLTASAATILPQAKVDTVTVDGRTLVCKSVKGRPIEADKSNLAFVFTAIFSSKVDQDSNFGDPLLRRPEVRWSSVSGMEPAYQDFSDPPKAIVNSAGESFDPQLEFPVADPVLYYSDYVIDYDPTLQISMQAAPVNSGSFSVPTGINGGSRSVGAGQARLVNFGATSVYENGQAYMRRDIEIHFRQDGWNPTHVLDQGFCELIGDEKSVIKDSAGLPLNAPSQLNGSGLPLAAGATPTFLDFKGFRTSPFGALALRFP